MRRLKFLTPLLLLVSSCNLQPPYYRPDYISPCAWRVEDYPIEAVANCRWWEQLATPFSIS